MKTIKRILFMSLILIMSFFFIKNNDKTNLHANSSHYGEVFIGFNDEDNVMIENLSIDVYDAIPIFANGEVVRFEHNYVNTYEVTKSGLTIDKPSEHLLIKANLKNIPSGYGIDCQSFFVTSNCDSKFFSIKEICNVAVEIKENNQKHVIFTSNNNEQIYADYNLFVDNEFYIVTNHNKNYYVFPQKNIIEEESNYNIYSDYNLETEYSYYPTNYEVDTSRFVVKYNSNTMSEENAMKVYNTIIDINQYLCLNTDFNFPEPKTTNSDFVIELVSKNEIDKISGKAVDGITYSYINEYDEAVSYIKLQYELLTTTVSSIVEKYKIILAHEYFHAIIAEMTQLSNSEGFNWINESFSTFIAILYASYRNIESAAIKSEYGQFIKTFYNERGTSFDQFSSISGLEYSSFIFPLYLYQTYGINIIKNIILNYEYSTNSLDVFYDVLETYNTNFNTVFKEFSTAILFAEYNFPSIDEYYTSNWNAGKIDNSYLHNTTSTYVKNDIDSSYLSNSYFNTKFETCGYHDLFVTVEVSDSSNYNLIYGTLGDNEYSIYNSSISNRIITIPCYNYGTSEKREWRCTVNNSTGSLEPTTINFSLTLEHKDLSINLNDTKSAIEHFHNKMTEVRYKFIPTTTNIYEFTIDTLNENQSSMNGIYLKVVNENNEVLVQTDNSGTFTNSNNIYALLTFNNVYYLVVQYNPNYYSFYYKCDITVANVSNYLNLGYDNLIDKSDLFLKQGDNAISISSEVNGVFNAQIEFEELSDISFNYKIYELVGNSLNNVQQGLVNSSNEIITCDININKNYKYFIVFDDLACVIDYYIKLERCIQNQIELQTDHSVNVTLGSEVRLRGSELNGRTIMEGYTRCLYIYSEGEYKSRLNYDLVSSNTNVAIITEYGTIIAKSVTSETTVKIIATKKNDYSEYGCIELTIVPDDSNEVKIVGLTTDCRVVGQQYGTEVAIKGGNPRENTIHVGYNRYICFESGNPSDSIQDFIWTSSNTNVAIVSSFGTITGVGIGECIIEGTYIYNTNFHALIVISVI